MPELSHRLNSNELIERIRTRQASEDHKRRVVVPAATPTQETAEPKKRTREDSVPSVGRYLITTPAPTPTTETETVQVESSSQKRKTAKSNFGNFDNW